MQQSQDNVDNNNRAQNQPVVNPPQAPLLPLDYQDPEDNSQSRAGDAVVENQAAVVDRQIGETKTQKYARVTSQHFSEQGIPYPDHPNAPRYDNNMIPFVPQSVKGVLTRHQPLGKVDRLPPVQAENLVQGNQTDNCSPDDYLKSSHEQQYKVMLGFIKTLFNNVDEKEFKDQWPEITRILRIIEALRSEQTTTKCGHWRDQPGTFGKKLIFTHQHNQNTVDSMNTSFLTYGEARDFLTQIISIAPTQDNSVLRQSARNALEVIRLHEGGANVIQDEYKLKDFPNQAVPVQCVPQQFDELEGYKANFVFNGVKQYSVTDAPDQENYCKGFLQGDTNARPDSTTSIINGMVSGVHSRRRHLLQNMLSQGGFVMTRILQQPDIVAKLGWLRKALLPHGGLNLLTLLDCDLAGSHAIGRLDAHDDFDLKIDNPEGFVRVFPILILNKDDEYLQSAPKKSRKKPTTNKPQSTGDNTHTESEQSGRPEGSGQRSVLESSLQEAHNSMFPKFIKSLDFVLKSLEQKATEMERSRIVTSETLKKQLYAVQEIWQSLTGEIAVVDSLAKLGMRKGKKVVVFCEVSTGHHCKVKSQAKHEAVASPPTLDTEYYDCDNLTILSEEHNAKMWVGQGHCNKYLKSQDSKVADHDQFVDFLNGMTDSQSTLPWERLKRKLRDHPVYRQSHMRMVADFTLIRMQCFTVVVHEVLSEGDAYVRQANLVLGNSEATRHLTIFKDNKTVEEAQQIIAHVSDFDIQSQHPYKLNGSKEKLSDLNKHYYEMVKLNLKSQSASPVPSLNSGKRNRRQKPKPSPQQVEQRGQSSLEEVVQQSLLILSDRSIVDRCIYNDLVQRNILLDQNAIRIYQPRFNAAYQLCTATKPIEQLPCYLFRQPGEINLDPQGVINEFGEQWWMKPLPLLLSPDQFETMLQLLQNANSPQVYPPDQNRDFTVLPEMTVMREVMLKGLSRALVVYLQMFQPVDQRHLRTHIMFGNLLQNFAHGVLGLRVSFDFTIALRQHERVIADFVAGLFKPNNRERERQFTKDNIDEFKEYYRDQITTAARIAEDEYYKNYVRNREDQARAQAAEVVRTMNNLPRSPSLTNYHPSPPPSRGNGPASVPPSRDQSYSRNQTGLYTPAHELHGSLFNQPQVINTPTIMLNSVDRTTRVGMHNQVVDPTTLTRILDSLQQQNANLNNFGLVSPALYASQANQLVTPPMRNQSDQTIPAQASVQTPLVGNSASQQSLRKSQRQVNSSLNQSAAKPDSSAPVHTLQKAINRIAEPASGTNTKDTRPRKVEEGKQEEDGKSNLGKRGHGLSQKEPKSKKPNSSDQKKKRDDKKEKKN